MVTAVIATIGQDRPGIVNELSALVHELELNIEDSRMTVLGGEFAVLMSVAGEANLLDVLQAKLTALCAELNLAFLFRKTEPRIVGQSIPYQVTVVAMDHPGIVSRIAGFFSERGVNISELNTETEPAAHTGTPIFNLLMVVELPAGVKAAGLRGDFGAFCEDEDLDGSLEAG